LRQLAADDPFDMVFLDAEKKEHPAFLAWAVEHVRPGGLITAHNAFRSGKIIGEGGDSRVIATRAFLEALAHHDRLISTIIPVGDGLAAAVVK
jgi:caffeoyl-CoA O-methyltransferase